MVTENLPAFNNLIDNFVNFSTYIVNWRFVLILVTYLLVLSGNNTVYIWNPASHIYINDCQISWIYEINTDNYDWSVE